MRLARASFMDQGRGMHILFSRKEEKHQPNALYQHAFVSSCYSKVVALSAEFVASSNSSKLLIIIMT
jgi:hypothetical protein